MSVRYGLLALLAERPMYGNQLRAEFEGRTAATWPLNVGQVYTTLERLVRDGLVVAAGADEDGRLALTKWWATPLSRESRPRDELTIKLALAVTVPGVDVRSMVQTQRADTMRALQDYTRLKSVVDERTPSDIAWVLVLESMIFQAESEIRWLDHCESRLVRRAKKSPPLPTSSEPAKRGRR